MSRFPKIKKLRTAFAALLIILGLGAQVYAAAGGSIGAWTTNPNPLPQPRQDAASAVYNGFVYEADGWDGSGPTNTLYYAPINTDHSLGSWSSGTVLPAAADGVSLVAYNGYLYAFGGLDPFGVSYSTAAYSAPINNDGSIGSWTTSGNTLPSGVAFAGAVVNNGRVYIIGGSTSGGGLDTTYYATLSNGSVGSWTTSPNALPSTRQFAPVGISGNHVYVLGGFIGGNGTDTVYYTSFNNDGSINPWTTNTTTLPQPLYGNTTITSGDGYIYVLGGEETGANKDTVYYAKPAADGSIAAWTTNAVTLPLALSFHTSVFSGGYAYLIGGVDQSNTTQSAVYYAAVTADPVVAASPTSSSSSAADPAAPNTGAGQPAGSRLAVSVVGGCLIVGGLVLLRQKRARS